MTANTSDELTVIAMDLGVGVVGFVLSIGWGKATRTTMPSSTVRLLAIVWAGIGAFRNSARLRHVNAIDSALVAP
jgi:hypothetical protein